MADAKTKSLRVRLAESEDEILAAQRLRFEVFSSVRDAAFSEEAQAARRDIDKYEPYCDHLVVIDPARVDEENLGIMGTYRVMSRAKRPDDPGFYTESLYDLSCFDDIDGEVVELGRVCIDPSYKARAVMQLLWKGIAEFVVNKNVKILFGCAGFDGTDAVEHQQLLSYLHHKFLAPKEIRPVAYGPNRLEFDLLPADEVDEKTAFRNVPSIIRGYSRMGGYIGEGAVVNKLFNTTMVCIVVDTTTLTDRYMRHFIGGQKRD